MIFAVHSTSGRQPALANGDDRGRLSHLFVQDRTSDRDFHRRAGGDQRARPIEDRATHGRDRIAELESAFATGEEKRSESLSEDELRALGTIVVLEGEDPAYPLKVDSLQRF